MIVFITVLGDFDGCHSDLPFVCWPEHAGLMARACFAWRHAPPGSSRRRQGGRVLEQREHAGAARSPPARTRVFARPLPKSRFESGRWKITAPIRRQRCWGVEL